MNKIIILIILSLNAFAIGKFQYIKGNITIERSGKSIKINKKNNKILENDLIKVASDSLAIAKINKKVTIKIEENSQLKVEKLGTIKKQETSILMETGSAFVDFFNKDKRGKLTYKTRQAVMGIRGTRFFVSYGNSADDAWMCVRNGIVEVTNKKGRKVQVKAGEGLKIQKNSLSDPKYLPWTSKLNWNFNSKKDLKNKVDISEAYSDPLEFEYD